MRKLMAVLFAVVFALSACSDSDSDSASSDAPAASQLSGRDLVLASADKAVQQKTAKTDFLMTMSGVPDMPGTVNFTGTGAFNLENGNGTMSMDLPLGGLKLKTEARILDGTFYYKYTDESGAVQTPKPWLKVTPEDLLGQGGASALSSSSSSPDSSLDLLRTSGADVTEAGKEQIRGVDTTHYKVQVSPAEMANSGDPKVKAQGEELKKIYGETTIPADVWIDGDGLLRKMTMNLDLSKLAQGATQGSATLGFEFYDYGTPVDVVAPPADEVMDFKQAMSGMASQAAA